MSDSNFAMVYPDDLFFYIYHGIYYFLTFSSIPIYSFYFYAIIKKSPKEMGNYKWYIFANALTMFLCDFFGGILHFYFILPNFDIVINGIFDYIKIESFPIYILCLAATCALQNLYFIAIQYLYRYAQTLQKTKITDFLDNYKSFFLHLSIFIGLLLIWFMVIKNVFFIPNELMYNNKEIYKRIKDSIVISVKRVT